MLRENKELYEFGPFRLDVTEHTLSRTDGAKSGSLPEKAFQTLCLLVRNSGHLLSKSEILDQVWPDSFIEENNLDKSIHVIRQTLGERPGEQKYIETVRKHGYRFVAEVERPETSKAVPASTFNIGPLPAQHALKADPQPTISTEMTNSGAVVVSAKWYLDADQKKIAENGDKNFLLALTNPQPALIPKPASWPIRRSKIAAVLLFAVLAGVAALLFFYAENIRKLPIFDDQSKHESTTQAGVHSQRKASI